MKYSNPIIPGMYADPSICSVDGKYYLVNSTFEYFPGIPVFFSEDLINWRQIGNCLTRESQNMLSDCSSSGGIFAPTIRYYNGEFYLITSCMKSNEIKNFYIHASDPCGEWSDPIYVEFEGIDPSFFWEDGKTYVQYAEFGQIFQIQIELETGKILKGAINITNGCGGRDVEGPHMWKKDDYYYLMLAEGGTREGHMVTMLRGKNIWGPFEPSPYNPVISNKDYGREPIQCVGHADWVVDKKGNDYLVTLGTRHVKHKTILGRETMLTPAHWTSDGWLSSKYGYMPLECEIDMDIVQRKNGYFKLNMNSTKMQPEVISPRHKCNNYTFKNNSLIIKGNKNTLYDMEPSLWAVRQTEFDFRMNTVIGFTPDNEEDEAGIVMYVSKDYHMSLFITIRNGQKSLVLRKSVADVITETIEVLKNSDEDIELIIRGNKKNYEFLYKDNRSEVKQIGWTYIDHLSIECASSPNVGVVGGIFIVGDKEASVKKFLYSTEVYK